MNPLPQQKTKRIDKSIEDYIEEIRKLAYTSINSRGVANSKDNKKKRTC